MPEGPGEPQAGCPRCRAPAWGWAVLGPWAPGRRVPPPLPMVLQLPVRPETVGPLLLRHAPVADFTIKGASSLGP